MMVTALQLAQRFKGIHEVPGPASNPAIEFMHMLAGDGPTDDDISWCSSFVFLPAWLLNLSRPERSIARRARSWLFVGSPVTISEATPGMTVAIFQRGTGIQPGPNVLEAPGHVTFYAGMDGGMVQGWGGNQHDEVNLTLFPQTRLLGLRELRPL